MNKTIFGILLNAVAKTEKIQQVLLTIQQLRVIKLKKKQKQFQQILIKKI